MATFVLSEEVEPLGFDFEPFGPKGEISEPTSSQIQDFRTTVAKQLADQLPDVDVSKMEDTKEIRRVMLEVIGRDQTESQAALLRAIANVCSNKPSLEELQALPYRHQQAFAGWVTQLFLLPQAATSATNS